PQKPPKAAEEERLTAEEWEERLKAEEAEAAEAKQQPKTMTREEFLAMKEKSEEAPNQPVAAPQQQVQAQPKRRMGFIDTLQANVNEALGVVPSSSAQTQIPAETSLQEMGQEGLLSSMRQNPIVSGIVALTGLIVMLIGTFSHAIEVALITEIIGLIIFVLGLIFIIKYLLRKK
ncbi:MAG: hypothetical protein QXS81_05115, partial [Candidatus Micrarchaeaceae archaeon]